MVARHVFHAAFVAVMLLASPPPARADDRPRALAGTVDALLDLEVRPFAIGHRGYGADEPEHPSRPTENTVASVRKAFTKGITIVEIDVQLTRDRHVVAFHDDVLVDGLGDVTCLNRLTLAQLREWLPRLATLDAILHEARRFNQAAGPLRGIVIVELKAARPLCDPHDRQDRPMVDAAARVIRQLRMGEQVLFTSFSPAMLDIARERARDIPRILAASLLQFLDRETVERIFQMPVTEIDKAHGLGLRWGEIGTLHRLPGYRNELDESFARSLLRLRDTALAVEARAVEVDVPLLAEAGRGLVQLLQAAGLKVFGFTVDEQAQWDFMEALGVDGIYTNDIPLGLDAQAPIP